MRSCWRCWTKARVDPETLADWQAADALFDQWLDLPETGRDAWLAAQTATGPVRQRLGQLIDAHRSRGGLFAPMGSHLAGHRLGDWTLDSELGRGGMAVVYSASREDGITRQRAALKILTLGALGTVGRDRFQREAEILARLNHPNITPLIDSGVAADGTCWLAMPLVEGQRIDAWCDSRRLDARGVVGLVLQVCEAVGFAHRSLVIHRDLKPSNVLIEADGHVRLLDFGIGQFTDAPGDVTRTLWRAMTPGYAAPEQLRGDPPSTAIDIYGLGALLHRLLTGRTPEPGGPATTTRPSLLVRSTDDACHRHYAPLKSDLDRVLLKALAEEPAKRYPSAGALADDLRRWRDGMPVLAQPPSLAYRARKFIGRHKPGMAAALLLVATLAGGIGTTLWQAAEARREAANARSQAQRAVLVREFLEHVFQSTEPAAGGVPDALEILDEGARRARSEALDTDPLVAADVLMLTGRARTALDDLDEAQADLQRANGILSATEGSQAERARVEADLAHVMRLTGRTAEAIAHGRRAVELGALALAEGGDATPWLHARIQLGDALTYVDREAARAEFEAVLDALPSYGLQDTELQLMAFSGASGIAYMSGRDMQAHAANAEEILRLSRLVYGPDSGGYASVMAGLSVVFLAAHRDDRAGEIASGAVALVDRIYTGPHSVKAYAYCAMGGYFYYTGRSRQALHYYAVSDAIYGQLPNNQQQIESCFRMSGHAHLSAGEYATGLARLERAWESLGRLDYRHTKQGYDTCGLLATAQLRLGEPDRAAHTLSLCPEGDDAPRAILRMQAQAELHFARGQLVQAAGLTAAIRERYPPEADASRFQWMRAWMLSLLMARSAGDAASEAALVTALGGLGELPAPLARCLAHPDEANCLVVP